MFQDLQLAKAKSRLDQDLKLEWLLAVTDGSLLYLHLQISLSSRSPLISLRGVNRGMQIHRSVPFFRQIRRSAKIFVQIRNHNHIRK